MDHCHSHTEDQFTSSQFTEDVNWCYHRNMIDTVRRVSRRFRQTRSDVWTARLGGHLMFLLVPDPGPPLLAALT